jgi:hypothetical protein
VESAATERSTVTALEFVQPTLPSFACVIERNLPRHRALVDKSELSATADVLWRRATKNSPRDLYPIRVLESGLHYLFTKPPVLPSSSTFGSGSLYAGFVLTL